MNGNFENSRCRDCKWLFDEKLGLCIYGESCDGVKCFLDKKSPKSLEQFRREYWQIVMDKSIEEALNRILGK
jgi:hypothetical protein